MSPSRCLPAVLFACSACTGSAALPDAGPEAALPVCPLAAAPTLRWPVCVETPARCAAALAGGDGDGDGASLLAGDCDDRDPFVGPQAAEVCDLRDNDCDGEVDEGASCPEPEADCPISYPDLHVCGDTHVVAGTFLLPAVTTAPDAGPALAAGFATPFEVLVRRRETGELRRALTCPAPPETAAGFPFRFRLADPGFVVVGADYELLVHLRWYVDRLADPASTCFRTLPVVRTDAQTAAAWVDLGAFGLWCL